MFLAIPNKKLSLDEFLEFYFFFRNFSTNFFWFFLFLTKRTFGFDGEKRSRRFLFFFSLLFFSFLNLLFSAEEKRILYVGGLEESVDDKLLLSAFIPFGDVIQVQIPLEMTTQTHKGFGFVEFELPEDAKGSFYLFSLFSPLSFLSCFQFSIFFVVKD